MSKLIIGTAQFGSKYGISNKGNTINTTEARQILLEAKKNGINFIDTALTYDGSQKILSELNISSMNIITKLPKELFNKNVTDHNIFKIIEDSLTNLKLDNYYGVLLHDITSLSGENFKRVKNILYKLKEKKYTKKIGVSVYSPQELETILDKIDINIVQAPFNILDTRFYNSGWIEKLSCLKIEFHARSIFLQGLLLFKKNERPIKFSKYKKIWNVWDEWLTSNKLSPINACVNFVKNIDEIDKIVFGVEQLSQFREVLKIPNKSLNNMPDWPKNIDEKLLNPTFWKDLI